MYVIIRSVTTRCPCSHYGRPRIHKYGVKKIDLELKKKHGDVEKKPENQIDYKCLKHF